MRWEDERYVRIYTRDTGDMILMGWEARALFYEIIRKADRAGILDLGKAGKSCLGDFLHMPQDVVDRLLPILVENEMIVETPTALIVRNYIDAQEAVSTPASRQRYSREYRRDMIRRGLAPGQRDCAVYFVQSEDGGPIKIGRAEDVAHRLLQLQTSRPDKLVLLAAAPATFDEERRIQEAFAQHRVKGEWFSPVPGLLNLAKSVSSLGSIPCDLSQFVTSLSVPCLAVPSRTVSVSESSIPLPAPDRSKLGAKSAHDWYEFFKAKWWQARGRQYGQGEADAKGEGRLHDVLQSLPPAERAADWDARERMVAEFLAKGDPRTAGAGWSFSFFVSEFNGLRIPAEKRPKPEPRPGQPRPVHHPRLG